MALPTRAYHRHQDAAGRKTVPYGHHMPKIFTLAAQIIRIALKNFP